MNKHLYRIIFNAARGQRMVVSEVASSHGCGGGDTGQAQCPTSAFGRLKLWLSPIALATGALAASAWYLPVHAQITADPKAPGNQRPTVLPAANGVPVVNIQTPSAAGVSRNTYSQFDVHAQGAVLNNSRTNAQTQQAGWVAANPWLATGSARVILNEVNSSNPSHLNGYVEVAGQRAEVILANPAGIQVNGGGFINAAGVTLTTGTPVMQGGSLDSFLVRGGQINVAGLGLDTSTADATRILARAVQVNASIWAKDLTAVVGSNQVKALVSGGAATATKIASSDPASAPMPAFALDVASIGGMYAGKIYMVGTDTGLGVNNQGTLSAQTGTLTLLANGQIVNTGTVQAKSGLALQTTDAIRNTGKEAVISAADGAMHLAAQNIHNEAGYIVAGGNISVTAQDTVANQQGGEIVSAARIEVTADGIVNTSGASVLARNDITFTASNAVNNSHGTLSAGQHLKVQDTATARALAITNTDGLAEAGETVTLHALSLSGDGKVQSAGDLLIDLQSDFDSQSDLFANRNAQLRIGGTFTNQARLQAGQDTTVTASNIDNTSTGEISGQTRTALQAASSLDNRGLIDGPQVRIDARQLTNIGTGRIYGDHIAVAAATLTNDTETLGTERKDAVIAARQRLDIGVHTLVNRENALIFSGGSGEDALNIGGALDANGYATGQASLVHNASATIESLGGLSIAADLLKNTNEHFTTELELVKGPASLKYIQPEGSRVKVLAENFVWQRWSKAGQYRYKNSPPVNDSSVLGQSPVPNVGEETCVGDESSEVCTRQPGADYLADNPAWAYFGVTPPATPEPAAPSMAKPIAPSEGNAASCAEGAGYDLNLCTSYQAALAQYNTNLAVYDQAWADYTSTFTAWAAETDPLYEALDAKISAYNSRFASSKIRDWTEFNVTRSEYETKVKTSAPGQILSGGDMRLSGGDLANDKSRIIAGGSLTGNLANVANIEAMGQYVIHEEGTSQSTWSKWRGGYRRYHQRRWGATVAYRPADEVQSIVLPVAEKLQNTRPAGSNTQLATQNQSGSVDAPLSSGPTLGSLPSSSLFKQNPSANALYLIETDARFADYRSWLGSDYMLKAMGSDPGAVQKRLGDGFYEQRLVREQVAQLTGRRFLDGFANDEAQYQALMDAGVTVAQNWNLVPGIALSALQIAALTSDIVWLVAQEVTLADGSRQSVLTPQIYLRPRAGDLTPEGSLLAGHSVDLNLSGSLNNAGTIAGRSVVSINARNIDNMGGLINAKTVLAKADQDINLVGGRMQAQDGLFVQAGNDLNISSTTQSGHNQAGASSFSRTALDRVAGLYVTGDAGVLIASAGNDMSIVAGVIDNAGKGSTALQAQGNLHLGTVTTALQENNVHNAKNYLKGGNTQEVGSQIRGGGNVTMVAGADITARAASVQAADALAVQAGNSIAVQAGEATDNYAMGYVRKSGGTFNKSRTTVRNSAESTTAVGASLGGKTVEMQAGKDIAITASQVISDQGTSLVAKDNVAITAGLETSRESQFREEKKSGVFSGGGIGFTVGTQQQSTDQAGRQTSAAASTVGSVAGNVTIVAGNQYRQTGSDVIAPQGDINVVAKDIAITEARQRSQSSTEQRFKQSGLSVSIGSPIISALETADSMAKAASNTSSGRMQALAAGATALNVYNTRKDLQGAADALASGDVSNAFSVSVSVGTSKSQSTSTQSSDSARASTVLAGGNVNLQAQGAGQDSDILVRGSDISAGKDVALKAEGDILLQAAQNLASQSGKNSSSSGSIGMSVGKDTGITLSASKGRGNEAGDDLVHANTHITAGNTVSLQSGADTTLQGAVVKGETVKAQVGGNLHIESLQDSSTYASRSQSIGGSITIGPAGVPTGGSFNASKSKVNSDYLSVVEQSGIKAGDGGFDVQVQGDTSLKGAVIASNQVAVEQGRNHFSTEGELTISDLQNSARYEGKAIGVNASVGNDNGKFGVSGVGAGVGQDSGSASSTTTAGISGIAGDQSVRSTDAETGIQRIFDKEKVQKEIDAQVAITAEFGKQASKAGAQYAQDQLNKASGLREIAKLEADPEKQAAMFAEAAQIENDWKDGGGSRVLMHAAIGLLSGGAAGAVGAAGSALATPYLADMMRDASLPQPVRDALLLSAGAAIGAAAGGLEGAVAGTNEMANNGLGTVVKRLGLGGVAMCLQNPTCLALTGATGLELGRLASLAMEKNPGISEDGAYAIAVTDYLADQVRGRPSTPPPAPIHTGGNQTQNPNPEGSSTTYPAEGQKEGAVVGGKPIDQPKAGDNILPGSSADPLPGIGPIFNERADGGGKVSSGSQATGALDNVATTIHPGQQGKHVPGDNNFIPGRSTLNANVDPQQLLDGLHGGQYPVIGTGLRGQPIVDFGKPIGVDAATGLPTQYGTIHSGKNGAHIVPTNPSTIGK